MTNLNGFMERPDWTQPKDNSLIDLSNNVCFDSILRQKVMVDCPSILAKSMNYPNEYNIYRLICSYYKLDMGKMSIGLGSTDLIYRILFLLKKRRLKILSPTFDMVKVYASMLGIDHEIESFNGFDSIHLSELVGNQVLYVANPNGNNGHSFTPREMNYLIKNNGFVIIDEAYIDYSKHPSLLELVNKYENVCILRTFSKSLGFAGVRCGFCYSNPHFTKSIQDIRMNYVSCGVTEYILKNYINEIDESVKRMKDAKSFLCEKYDVINENGNFICIKNGISDFHWAKTKSLGSYERITLTNKITFETMIDFSKKS